MWGQRFREFCDSSRHVSRSIWIRWGFPMVIRGVFEEVFWRFSFFFLNYGPRVHFWQDNFKYTLFEEKKETSDDTMFANSWHYGLKTSCGAFVWRKKVHRKKKKVHRRKAYCKTVGRGGKLTAVLTDAEKRLPTNLGIECSLNWRMLGWFICMRPFCNSLVEFIFNIKTSWNTSGVARRKQNYVEL